jgi:hypothetical protein
VSKGEVLRYFGQFSVCNCLSVEFQAYEPLCVGEAQAFPQLSRITLSDNISMVAAGVVRNHTEVNRPGIFQVENQLIIDITAIMGIKPFNDRLISKHFNIITNKVEKITLESLKGVNLVILNLSEGETFTVQN